MGGRLLIVGCGYVGRELARRAAARGWAVRAVVRTPHSAAALAKDGIDAVAGDASQPELWRGLGPPPDAVVACAAPGRGEAAAYEAVYQRLAVRAARFAAGRPFLFTSSTSVYAQEDGSEVTEDSPAEPASATGRILRAAEDACLGAGGCVARVTGIYGPGRSVWLRRFREGTAALDGHGSRWLNQAHRDDIAAGILFLVERGAAGIFNLSDNEPVRQRDLFMWLAERLGLPMPGPGPENGGRKGGASNKRVLNARLRGLGWVPEFPTFREGLERVLTAG